MVRGPPMHQDRALTALLSHVGNSPCGGMACGSVCGDTRFACRLEEYLKTYKKCLVLVSHSQVRR